jgi:hypothetical protein
MKKSFWLRFKSSDAHTQVNIVCTFIVMIATIVYVIIAGFQLVAMNGQIEVMRGTLAETKRSGEQSTEQMWSAIGNINWMARTADESLHQAQHAFDAGIRANMQQLRDEQRPYIWPLRIEKRRIVRGEQMKWSVLVGNLGILPR